MRSRPSRLWNQLRPIFCLLWKELLGGPCPHLSLNFQPSACVVHLRFGCRRAHLPQNLVRILATKSAFLIFRSLKHSLRFFTSHTGNHQLGGKQRKSLFCIVLKTCLSWVKYSTHNHSLGILYCWITNHILSLVSIDSLLAHLDSYLTKHESFGRGLSSCPAQDPSHSDQVSHCVRLY